VFWKTNMRIVCVAQAQPRCGENRLFRPWINKFRGPAVPRDSRGADSWRFSSLCCKLRTQNPKAKTRGRGLGWPTPGGGHANVTWPGGGAWSGLPAKCDQCSGCRTAYAQSLIGGEKKKERTPGCRMNLLVPKRGLNRKRPLCGVFGGCRDRLTAEWKLRIVALIRARLQEIRKEKIRHQLETNRAG